jgi:hypothetical protein
MNLNELFKLTGKVHVTLTNEHGEVVEQRAANLVVTTGKNFTASRMVGVASNVMSHMALGSSSTAAAVGDTTLGTELGRVALTAGTAANNVVTYTATFGTGVATGGVQEAGIFNASSAGILLCRVVFAVVNKGANDTIAITWTVTVG